MAQEPTSLGERLKALRSARSAALGRKLSQQEVANAIGVARSYVAACETESDKPGHDTFMALADYYGVSFDWLGVYRRDYRCFAFWRASIVSASRPWR